jgi:hypothetical protein
MDAIAARHWTREGVLLYEISLATAAQDLESGAYPMLADTPTFTGELAATLCLQAELEPGEAVRADARRALAGLETLTDVTGVPGLMTRSLRRDAGQDVSGLRGRWFVGGPGFEGYRWRADVSVDQYAHGLLPAAAACGALFPQPAARLMRGFAEHLQRNRMRIVDPDGRATRFGDLSRTSGLGFNSIFQLTGWGAFALAADLTGDAELAVRRDAIRDRDRVPARSRTTNLRVLGITNHSNDLMAFHLYRALIPLARRTGDPALADLRHGLARAWLRVRDDGNAYFAALHCALEPASCDRARLQQARALLEAFPLEKRRLAPPAALRDVPRRWLPGRKLRPLARELVPIELRPVSSFEWKSSPYRLDYEVKPELEYTGLDFLAAYWMLRAAEQILAGGPVPPSLR